MSKLMISFLSKISFVLILSCLGMNVAFSQEFIVDAHNGVVSSGKIKIKGVEIDRFASAKNRIRKLYQVSKVRDEFSQEDLRLIMGEIARLSESRNLDLVDMQKVARLYAINGNGNSAILIFKKAIESIVGREDYTNYRPKSFLSLLNSYLSCACYKSDEDILSYYVYAKTIPQVMLDDSDKYRIAIIAEKIREYDDEKVYLSKLIDEKYTLNEIKGKAMFRLGKILAWEKDYEASASVYKLYIDTFPEYKVFALKAYQKYVDNTLLAENRELDEESAQKVVDFMNSVGGDAESTLEAAVYIKEKGYKSIATPLFDMAYKELLQSAQTTDNIVHKRSRITSLIRASYNYMDYDRVINLVTMLVGAGGVCKDKQYVAVVNEEGYIKLRKTPNLIEPGVNIDEDSYRHTSYALIWAATAYRDIHEYEQSIKHFDYHLSCMPNHEDNDYAAYRIFQMHKALGNMELAYQYAAKVKGVNYREMLENEFD